MREIQTDRDKDTERRAGFNSHTLVEGHLDWL